LVQPDPVNIRTSPGPAPARLAATATQNLSEGHDTAVSPARGSIVVGTVQLEPSNTVTWPKCWATERLGALSPTTAQKLSELQEMSVA
jgi:hypothetical protein